MRIDIQNQRSSFKQGRQSAKATDAEQKTEFQKALQQFTKPSEPLLMRQPQPPQLQHQNLYLELYSKAFLPEQLKMTSFEVRVEQFISEQNLDLVTHEVLEEMIEDIEIRTEDIEEDSIENMEEMEELQDDSEERFRQLIDGKDKGDEMRVEDKADKLDDIVDDDPEYDPEKELEENLDDKEKEQQFDYELIVKKGHNADEEIEVEEMTFEEIRDLAKKVLSRHSNLPPRVYSLLNTLLDQLLQGYRLPLDQHRLSHLDVSEWSLLLGLFPPRFFSGLIRPLVNRYGQEPGEIMFHHQLFHELQYQRPISREAQQSLTELYKQVLPRATLPQDWLHGEPLGPINQHFHRLLYFLESQQQNNAFLPGATGKTLSLALAYSRHREVCARLYHLSQKYLQALPPTDEDLAWLTDLLYERCYTHQMLQKEAVMAVLQKALTASPLKQAEVRLLFQGIPQGILDYCPHYLLSDKLKQVQIAYFSHLEWAPTLPKVAEENQALSIENPPATSA